MIWYFMSSLNFSSYTLESKLSKVWCILDSERIDECIDFTMMCFFIYLFFLDFQLKYLVWWKSKFRRCIEVNILKFQVIFKSVEKIKKN